MQGKVPFLIHLINLGALLLLGAIIVLTGVMSVKGFVLLLPVLALMLGYWVVHRRPNIVAFYFGIPMCLLVWIVFCENIVRIENLTGLRITERLALGLRLERYIDQHLTREERNYTQQCCGDPLTWNYRPHSTHRVTYDCDGCNAPHQTIVDETGFLNQARSLRAQHQQIDLFIAGDSVLQGFGVISVFELLRQQLPVITWNLSVSGYGPRQKISALLAHAVEHHPKWLLVEFYARNDVSDAITDDVCAQVQDFHCRFSPAEVPYRLMQHPVYRQAINEPDDVFSRLAYHSSQSFTLAVTRHMISSLKLLVKQGGTPVVHEEATRERAPHAERSGENGRHSLKPDEGPDVVFLATPVNTSVRRDQWLALVTAGLRQVHKEYLRLVQALAGLTQPPTVLLLYNPTPYELYRDILTPRDSLYDEIAKVQRQAQRTFAETHGWLFVDLTDPLRQAIKTGNTWLYGRHDPSHWSAHGTALVASVMETTLSGALGLSAPAEARP